MDALRARLSAALASGPDPAGAAVRLARWWEAAVEMPGGAAACLPGPFAEQLLCGLLGQSPALAARLQRAPLAIAGLAATPYLTAEKPEVVMRAELAARRTADSADVERVLRHYVGDEMVRLGARELGLGPPTEVARELGALASVCLDLAIGEATRSMAERFGPPLREDGGRCRFVAIGMGKLGGEELNFSSDIDLLFAYETDAGTPAGGALSLHEYFSRLAGEVVRLVGDVTADGFCFRVDLGLRPEGNRGPLVNSLPALERYYESWGRPWERQAWIKARPVAGDHDLGDEILALLEPFVWPRARGPEAIRMVQELMARIRAEHPDPRDVKLGPGGIREVEFFVQALQLVHGGPRRSLRERSTLRALDKLLFAGLVSEREQRRLGDAYMFLRRIEHRLQLEELRQTHRVPDDSGRLALLAQRLGYAAAATFEADLERHRAHVRALFATLGQLDEPAHSPARVLADPGSERPALVGALGVLGFANPEAATDEIEHLRRRPLSPFSPTASGAAARAAPILVEEMAACPDPDLALRWLADLAGCGGRGERAASGELWQLCAEYRPVGRLLMNLFGTSEYLARVFVDHPEFIEHLVSFGRAPACLTLDDHRRALSNLPAADSDEEARLNTLRRYRNEEVLRIGLHDIAGDLELDEVSRQLSQLAEACLEAALGTVTPTVQARLRVPLPPLAVVGMGKLGGQEMTYSSDLDLIFVFAGDDEVSPAEEPSPLEATTRLAQRLIHALGAHLDEGRLYEIDTRLRPSGQRGALVSSLGGFARYHEREAALWERQALIKARVVAGDAALGCAVGTILQRAVWEGPHLDARCAADEIGRLRARMERELGHEAAGRFNLKSGRGGLLDVEFLVQYLQLVHGGEVPALRVQNTGAALAALAQAGLLEPDVKRQLDASYRFLLRLENRLRIVHDRPISEFGSERVVGTLESAGEPDKLARRLGYRGVSPGRRLLDDYREHTSSIRRIYSRYLPASI